MCKCKIYNAALLFAGLLVGIAAAVLFYFGIIPGVAAGLSAVMFAAVAMLFVLLLGVMTGCKCMAAQNECQNSAVVFSVCVAALALLFSVAAVMLLDGNPVLTAVAVGFAVMFFAAMVGSLAVTARYVTKPAECEHCRRREMRDC